jgi:type IX secretion system PorP/SprF family membrane protein
MIVVVRHICIIALAALLPAAVQAQQLPVSGLPFAHLFDAHPAVAGQDTLLHATMWNHSQWTRTADAPRTTSLSLTAPLKNGPLGWGLRTTSDVVGPTRVSSVHGALSYHVRWNESVRVSFGAALGALQYTLDGSRVQLEQTGDPVLSSEVQSTVLPDASASIWVEGGRLFGGASLQQLLGSALRLSEPSSGQSHLEDHFTAILGCRLERGEWTAVPIVQFTHLRPARPDITGQIDIAYQDRLWGTLGYRNTGGITLGLGTRVHQRVIARYAYEVNTGPLASAIGGGHTVVLSFTTSHHASIQKSRTAR